MAELLISGGWAAPASMGAYLRDRLPDDWYVVAGAVVYGCPIEVVVVSPAGLTAVEPPSGSGATSGQAPAAARQVKRGAQEAPAVAALRAFLHDEFPSLKPPLRRLNATCREMAGLAVWEAVDPATGAPQPLEQTLSAAWPPLAGGPAAAVGGDSLPDEALRESLALALRDRQLTASMRAARPFVFRSGTLGGGTKAWTVRAAVAHMARHPDDGIYHMRNGTLGQWLQDEGAGHLAELVRASLQEYRTDGRAALEHFLIGTGLVKRPRLRLRPETVDLGYVLAGEDASSGLRVSKGRGRGYLAGSLEPGTPWLEVEPRVFAGKPLEATISARTDTLPIAPTAHVGSIHLMSNAAEGRQAIPVRIHVAPTPSPLHRYGVRTTIGLLLAGLPGAIIGLLFGLSQALPGALTTRLPLGRGALILPLALIWGACGALMQVRQPPAWPLLYAARRWLWRTARWAAGLVVVSLMGLLYWRIVSQTSAVDSMAATKVACWALALSVLPATWREWTHANSLPILRSGNGSGPVRRRALAMTLSLVALAAVLAVPVAYRPAWQMWEQHTARAALVDWTNTTWDRLNVGANNLLDRLYVLYYDHRAPVAPTPTLTPTARATAQSNHEP